MRRILQSGRGRVALGLIVVTAVAGGALFFNAQVLGGQSEGNTFQARTRAKLAPTYYEVGVYQGTITGETKQIQLSPGRKVTAKPAKSFVVDPAAREVQMPAGSYEVYVAYAGTELKYAKERRCLTTTRYDWYCPTGALVEVAGEPVDVTTAISTYKEKDRSQSLFDASLSDKLWKQNGAAKTANLRLYPR